MAYLVEIFKKLQNTILFSVKLLPETEREKHVNVLSWNLACTVNVWPPSRTESTWFYKDNAFPLIISCKTVKIFVSFLQPM